MKDIIRDVDQELLEGVCLENLPARKVDDVNVSKFFWRTARPTLSWGESVVDRGDQPGEEAVINCPQQEIHEIWLDQEYCRMSLAF